MECGTSFDMKAYYTTIDNGNPPSKMNENERINLRNLFLFVLSTECGGEFESISGEIASPAYPNRYEFEK